MEFEQELIRKEAESFFKILHDRLTRNNDCDFEFVGKTMEDTQNNLNIFGAFGSKSLSNEEREAYSVYLSWMFNKLLSIAVTDKTGK